VFYGIKPAVTAIVVAAAHRIGSRVLRNGWLWGIAVAAFVAIFALDVPFPAILAAAAAIGYAGGRIAPARFAPGGGHGGGARASGPALIGDDTPTPPHARFSWRRLMRAAGLGIALWAASIGALIAVAGADGTLAHMAWFFTKAALLTFGGAYAVLPYVVQAAVEQYQWATPAQMIDGLALGETTPGPLIMVVAFVGFVGAWTHAIFGTESLFAAGAAGAAVATFFTFLPSFVFIFAGAPFVETTRDNLKLAAPLTAITAAVVGVIVNLALFFAVHVLWPRGFAGSFDWIAALIGVAAAVALVRYKASVLAVVAASAAVGLALSLAPGLVPAP
jgi:chromate transporter